MSNLTIRGRLRMTELPGSIAEPIPEEEIARLIRQGRARTLLEGQMNLVVDIGVEIVTKMIGSARGVSPTVDGTAINDVDDLQIAVVKLGNNVSPAAPAAGDTDLDDTTPIFTMTNVTVSYPVGGATTRFSSTLPANQIVGEAVTEEGLFISIPPTPTEKLFARLTFAAKVIAAAQAYQFDHDILVAAS